MNKAIGKIDLAAFCEPPQDKSNRYEIKSPWKSDGMIYATDGSIAIRCEPEYAAEFSEIDGNRPNARKLLDTNSSNDWVDVPPIPGPPKGCDLWWRKPQLCKLCTGTGAHPCDCLHCEKLSCDACNTVGIRAGKFRQRYLWLIGQLPGAQIAAAVVSPKDFLPFRFSVGIGVVASIIPVDDTTTGSINV